jgi:hypothetical protein
MTDMPHHGIKHRKILIRAILIAAIWGIGSGQRVYPQAASDTAPKNEPDSLRTSAPQPPAMLLPEGYRINGQVARLVKHPEQPRWFLAFSPPEQESSKSHGPEASPAGKENSSPEPKRSADEAKPAAAEKNDKKEKKQPSQWDPLAQPIEILPDKWLTAMQKVIGGNINFSIEFRIWGEIVVYGKRNFILPSYVATYSLFGHHPGGKTVEPTLHGPTTTAAAESGGPGGANPSQPEPMPDRLREMLMAMPRSTPLATAAEHSGTTISSIPAAMSASEDNGSTSRKDGDLIVDRVGRMNFDVNEQVWVFAFETDSQTVSEPPVILHPCRLLEIMERTVQQSNRPQRFRISGQVTRYQGRSYLLPRKMLIVHDLGNLSK